MYNVLGACFFHIIKHQKKLYIRLKNDNGFQFLFTISYFDIEKKYYLNIENSINDKKWFYKLYKNDTIKESIRDIEQFVQTHQLYFVELWSA